MCVEVNGWSSILRYVILKIWKFEWFEIYILVNDNFNMFLVKFDDCVML